MTHLSNEDVIEQIVESAVKDQIEKAPGLRQVHAKSHGCVWGKFTVEDNIPENLKYGVLKAANTYPVWIRFSNGSGPLSQGQLQSDQTPDVRGMAIKVLNVEGQKVLEDEPESQDFVLINNSFFFVRNAESYIRLGGVASGQVPAETLAYELGILQQITAKKTLSPLGIQYWSATAYRLGHQAIKLSAKPTVMDDPSAPILASDNYLREALITQLTVEQTDAYFDFLVQLQPTEDPRLIDDPTIPWDESISPYVKVATIRIPAQIFDTPVRRQFDESLSFSPWHTLPEHEPLGSVNTARLKLYQTIARNRREHNHQAIAQPQPYTPEHPV